MRVSAIVAHGLNGVMGKGGGLPWCRLAADMTRFRALTLGYPVIVGRKTFESPGFPLPGRPAVVLSRDPAYAPPGVLVANDACSALAAAFCLARAAGKGEVFVLGGRQVFDRLLCRADRVYRTVVNADFEGDATFPAEELRRGEWVRVESSYAGEGPGNPFSQCFDTLDRPPEQRSQVIERLSTFFDSAEACRDWFQAMNYDLCGRPCCATTSDLDDIADRMQKEGPAYFTTRRQKAAERARKDAEEATVEAAARAVVLADLREVFVSDEAFAGWMAKPNPGFGGCRPTEVATEELASAAYFLRSGVAN